MAAGTEQQRRTPPSTTRRRSRSTALAWWHEVLLVAIGYAIYTLIRNLVPAHRSRALHNAADIERWERALGIFREHGLNDWFAPNEVLSTLANYWYASMHFAITIVVAVWILWKHPRRARPLRIAWYSTNLLALIGYWLYPLAPPRLMPGFVDTIAKYGIWGNSGSAANADGASNQFAAMPSMHIGWSTWCAIVIVVLARRWWVKALGVAYPLITLVVIAATANHYFLDALGGLIALAGGFLIARLITGHSPLLPEALPGSDPPGSDPGTSPPDGMQPVRPRPLQAHSNEVVVATDAVHRAPVDHQPP